MLARSIRFQLRGSLELTAMFGTGERGLGLNLSPDSRVSGFEKVKLPPKTGPEQQDTPNVHSRRCEAGQQRNAHTCDE